MENILKLGGKTFEIKANFRLSYNLTKFRNKIATGFDFSEADKHIVEEILNVSKDGANFDITKLSPEAIEFLTSQSNKNMFSFDEIIEIVKLLTGINEQSEIEGLLDTEVAENGYDDIVNKLVICINMVFTNAKDISTQKAKSKQEIVKVAKK